MPVYNFRPAVIRWCVLLLVLAGNVVMARDIEFQIDSTASLAETQTKIKVGFADPKSPVKEGLRTWILTPVLDQGTPVVTDAKAWVVEATQGADVQKPEFTVQRVPRHGDPYMLILALKKPFDPNRTYTVHVAKGYDLSSSLLDGWHLINPEKAVKGATIDQEHIKADLGFIGRNKALEKNVSVKTGKDSSLSVKLVYGFDNWQKDHWTSANPMRFQAMLDAEGTYKPTEKNRYLNSIVGEMDGAFVLPPLGHGPFGLELLSDIGPSIRIESDQYFKDVDGSAGIVWWNAVNGDPVQAVGNFLCLFGEKPEPNSIAAVVFNLGYDWVVKINEDIVPQRHDNTDRVRANIYWSILLAHKVQLLELVGHPTPYDAHFVIDAGASYDFLNSRFVPDVKLSLELSPIEKTGKEPSLFVTYVNGKTRATFENYNALLGGVKLPF